MSYSPKSRREPDMTKHEHNTPKLSARYTYPRLPQGSTLHHHQGGKQGGWGDKRGPHTSPWVSSGRQEPQSSDSPQCPAYLCDGSKKPEALQMLICCTEFWIPIHLNQWRCSEPKFKIKNAAAVGQWYPGHFCKRYDCPSWLLGELGAATVANQSWKLN